MKHIDHIRRLFHIYITPYTTDKRPHSHTISNNGYWIGIYVYTFLYIGYMDIYKHIYMDTTHDLIIQEMNIYIWMVFPEVGANKIKTSNKWFISVAYPYHNQISNILLHYLSVAIMKNEMNCFFFSRFVFVCRRDGRWENCMYRFGEPLYICVGVHSTPGRELHWISLNFSNV